MEGSVTSLNKQLLCTLGKYDIPIVQIQSDFQVDLLQSNIAIFGSSASGKTNMLKLLINNIHKQTDETEEQIFILDFSGGLMSYKNLPLVSAYFDNSNEEYVKRVFKILETILKNNTKVLGSDNYISYKKPIIHTTFIIDNLNSFVDETRYTTYQEKFARLCREGRSRGISIVFAAADTKGISRYLLSFEQKAALCFPSDKCSEIFGEKADNIGNIPGRGYANITMKPENVIGTFPLNSPYEFQCYIAEDIEDNDSDIAIGLDRIFGRISETHSDSDLYNKHAKRYMTFPQELKLSEYMHLKQPLDADDAIPSETSIAVGLDYVDFKPIYADLENSRAIAIYGKRNFGKTNLLSVLIDGILNKRNDVQFVLLDDGRKQLQSIHENIKQKGMESILFQKFEAISISYEDGSNDCRKLSPLYQFYKFIHEEILSFGDPYYKENIYREIYGENYNNAPKGTDGDKSKPTIFVIQSKSVYVNSKFNTEFIRYILPELLDIAEDNDYAFIFSDAKKITDGDTNSEFNSAIKTVFLLDNIAEFASERGSKSVFGDMDAKSLKEDYASCELGDGYYYNVEEDNLKKMKFILKS